MKKLILILSILFSGLANAVTPVGVGLSPLPLFQFNQGGLPCSGCKLFQYQAGTTTKQNTYTDYTGTTPNANPIILDSNGQTVIYLQTGLNYKFTLAPSYDTDPPTNPYWTSDQIYNNAVNASPYADGTGTSDAITANYTVTSPILIDGYALTLGVATPNTTTAPTFSPTLNGQLQTARQIKKFNTSNVEVALNIGDLNGDASLIYDAPNLVWVLQNPKFPYVSPIGAFPTVASATTPDIFNTAGNTINYTGAITATGFVSAPAAGIVKTLICSGACSFTPGANLTIEGISPNTTTITLGANALVTVTSLTTTSFKLTYTYSGSFTANPTGCTTSPNFTVYFLYSNGYVDMSFPQLQCTSNATTFTITGAPSNLGATANSISFGFGGLVVDNGVVAVPVTGLIASGTSVITMYKGGNNNGWTNTGTKGLNTPQSIRYQIQ